MAPALHSEMKIEGVHPATGTTVSIPILTSTGVAGNYQLAPYGASWGPNVSKRKSSVLSGNVSYDPVEEEIRLNIVSTVSAADCTTKLTALINLLDQADRWFDNQYVFPVWFYYRPKGSTQSFLYNALILGNRSQQDWAQLPMIYDDVGVTWRIDGVVIKFLRSGLWLQTDIADTITGGLATPFVPTAATLAKIPSRMISLCDCSFGSFNTANIPQPIPSSVLILSNVDDSGTSHIVQKNALNLATGVKYTSVNDAAKNAVGTNVLRYTPTDTVYNNSAIASLDAVNGFNFAVYASLRNNAAVGTTQFTVQVNMISGGSSSTSASKHTSQETVIDASIQTPRLVFLGIVTRLTLDNPKTFLSIKASAASGSLDIDQLVFVAIDDETAQIIELPSFSVTNEVGAGTQSLGFWCNQGPLGSIAPYFGVIPTKATASIGTGSTYAPLSAVGDLPIVIKDKTIQWIWLCIAANSVDRWQFVDNTNTPLQTRLTVIQRHMGYLIPE